MPHLSAARRDVLHEQAGRLPLHQLPGDHQKRQVPEEQRGNRVLRHAGQTAAVETAHRLRQIAHHLPCGRRAGDRHQQQDSIAQQGRRNPAVGNRPLPGLRGRLPGAGLRLQLPHLRQAPRRQPEVGRRTVGKQAAPPVRLERSARHRAGQTADCCRRPAQAGPHHR